MGRLSMEQVLKDIAEIAGLISARGWAERNAGNVSVDVTDEYGCMDHCPGSAKVETERSYPELAGRCFLVTATGARFRDIAKKPEEHVFLARMADDFAGYYIVSEPGIDTAPLTSEFPSHIGIHAHLRVNDPDKHVVLHTHPDHLLALTHIGRYLSTDTLNRLLWSMHPEMKIVMPDGVGLVPYCLPGSETLADATVDILKQHRLVLWEKHGCVAVGRDVFEAFDLIDTAEKSAKVFLMVKSAGFEPDGLSDAQLDEL
ncbi:MAG: rhamnulose-1-phosphate aldolase [Thermoleophilia bacterium]|nr:rhamnulose-1-phosphate aldolase [Thermoleophilia bacterium]